MCITKLGQNSLPQYLWKGVTQLGKGLKWLGSKRPVELGAKSVGALTRIGKPIVKGVAATGRFIYNKPQIALPVAGLGYLGAKKLVNDSRVNMYHTDPKYNITRSNILGQIKYINPENKERYKELNFFNI